jgi:hypothetical protein
MLTKNQSPLACCCRPQSQVPISPEATINRTARPIQRIITPKIKVRKRTIGITTHPPPPPQILEGGLQWFLMVPNPWAPVGTPTKWVKSKAVILRHRTLTKGIIPQRKSKKIITRTQSSLRVRSRPLFQMNVSLRRFTIRILSKKETLVKTWA